MTLHDDSTNDFDPYFGLDITWRDSPLSEWLRPPAIDQMEEAAAADMATPIGRYLSVVGQGEISCRLDVLLEPLVTEQETLIFRRHQSLNTSSVEEFPSEYYVSPKPIPTRAQPSLKRKQAIPKLSVPTLETNLETKATCRPPKRDPEVEKKTKSSRTKTRRGGGKKAEPRRLQNMASHKKYRDKRANTANLMSRYIIKIRRALNDKSTLSSMKCLVNVHQIVDEYRESVKILDPNWAIKQDQAVASLSNEEDDD